MIKVQNRTPSVYTKESRDFQLLGHLFDAAFNNSNLAASTMTNNQGTNNQDYRFLELMCKTLGFNYKGNYTTNELRHVVKSFKYLISYKGTKNAIESAISLLLNSQNITDGYYIEYEPKDTNGNIQTSVINIYLPDQTQNIKLLEELFNYILPAGWVYSLITRTSRKSNIDYITDIALNDKQRNIYINEVDLSKSNYIKDNKIVSDDSVKNIGQVPETNSTDVISPVVNLGTVITSKDQTDKYNK